MSFDIALEPYYYPIVFTLHLDIRFGTNWSTDPIRLAHTLQYYDRRSICYSRKVLNDSRVRNTQYSPSSRVTTVRLNAILYDHYRSRGLVLQGLGALREPRTETTSWLDRQCGEDTLHHIRTISSQARSIPKALVGRIWSYVQSAAHTITTILI